jgi:glutamine amidotransferase
VSNATDAEALATEPGVRVRLTIEPAEIADADLVVLPGSKSTVDDLAWLRDTGLADAVAAHAASGRPVLGICAGMQLLATRGTEGGDTPGLGLVEAVVTRLPEESGLVIPHVGWSTVTLHFPHPVTEGVKPGRDFYFVHSYAMHTDTPEARLGTSDYGTEFVSIVARDNVVGFQFHPEKSQANGLKLIENFCLWDGTC